MFKKFKDKLAEEMKQSPARLQASMQQLAQAVVSPSVSNTSIQSLSASNDNFSLTEEGDETPKNSPNHHQGFQSVDLTSPNSLGLSRRSSVSSVASTEATGSLFPIYEGSSNIYHLQSDMDQSASEADDNISPNIERVTKEQVYSAYRKAQTKYHKYRGRYTDLATHYREMERLKSKLESLLVETQDKALRRIADLKEQCQLEQQAKAHLEEALRNDIEEKDHVIGTLNTKATTTENPQSDLLVDLSPPPEESPTNSDNIALKSKFEKLESLLVKYKESLKKSKEKLSEVTEEKNILERDFEALKTSNSEKFRHLEDDLSISRDEINNLRDQLNSMKKREEESAISLAENKLSIHRELEVKEEQIKKLNNELKTVSEAKENLSIELDKLTLKLNDKKDDDGVDERIKAIEREMQEKLIDLEEKMEIKHHEQVERNKELTEKIGFLEKDNERMKVYETELLKTREELEKLMKNNDENSNKDEMIQTLNSKIQMYAAAVQKAKEKIESQNLRIKELMENSREGELEEKNVEILGIRSELKSCKSTVSDLKHQLKMNSKEIEQLRREKNCLIANILDYKSKIEGLKSNCESIKLQLREYRIKEEEEILGVEKVLKDKLNRLKICDDNVESLEVLMRQNQELSEKIHQKNLEIEEISGKIENFNEILQKNKELTNEMEVKNSKIEELTLKIQNLHSEITIKDDEILQMLEKVETYDDTTRKNNKLIAEIDNLNFKMFDISKLKQELESTKTELSKSQQCLTTQAQQISSSSELTKELTQLKEKCETYTKKLTESLEKYKSLELENVKLKENEQELIKLRIDCENYTKLFAENLEKAKKLENDNETLKMNWEMAERDLEKLRNEISMERLENEGIKNEEIESLRSEILKKDNLIEERSSGLENLQQKYTQQNEELSQLKIQLEMHRKLLEESQEKSKYFENEISLQQQKLNTSEKDKSKLEEKLRIKSEELSSISCQNDKNLENLKIEEESHKKSTEKLENLERNLSQVISELENTKKIVQQNEENNSSIENENLSLKETLNSKNELIEKLKNLKNKQTKAIQELESKNEALRTSENNSKSQLEELLHLQEKLSALTLENEELSSKLSNLMSEKLKLDTQSQELLMLGQKFETLQSECENYKLEIKQLKDIENNLQKDEANYQMKIKSLQELNSTLETQISSLKSNLEEQMTRSKSTIEGKEKSHKEKMKQLEMEIDKLQNDKVLLMEENTKKLQEKDEKIKELVDKESWTNQMLEELRKRSEELENIEQCQNIDKKSLDQASTTIKSEEEKIEDERLHKLVEQLQLQLQDMESKLITSQAKESQLEILNQELKKEINRLKGLMETAEEENGMRMSQLVKEFQAQLQDKDGQIQAALDKNFEKHQGYESELVQQYREQLRDFQVELTAKSEEIESLRSGQKEVQKLVDTIADIKKEHANEMKEVETKWRTMKDKSEQLEGMEKEWQKEKFNEDNVVEEKDEELENMSRVAMAAVQSNTGSFHSLQQTLVSQRRELAELRKIVKLRHDALEDSTEIEYLRNILYEYMMGRETLVLARVIAAVVKFDQDQTNTILKKEEDKLTLLGSLGLS